MSEQFLLPGVFDNTKQFEAPSSGSIFSAARWSPDRATIHVPTLDTRKEIDRYSRLELLKKSRVLYRNIGSWRRVVDGAAELAVGTGLKPHPMTSDKDWNRRALDNFNERAGSRDVFDFSGKRNFYEAQSGLISCELRDGDVFAVLSEGLKKGARLAFYEGHQCGEKPQNIFNRLENKNDKFLDGVQTDRHNRAQAYRFINGDFSTVIPRQNVIPFMHYDTRGQNRGVTAAYHWLNDGQDLTEIKAYYKMAIKNSATIAFYMHDSGASGAPTLGGGKTKTEISEGVVVTTEDAYRGGKIPNTGSGKIDTLKDDRPHPNVIEFLNSMLRELALGVGLSAEVLFYMAGLRGAEVRMAIAGSHNWIKKRQQHLVDTFCNRYWVYHIAKEINAGRLPRPKDSNWWKVGWIAPAQMTVDIGRDGNLRINQHTNRLLTLQTIAGESGQHWEQFQDQTIREGARGARRLKEISKEEGVTAAETVAYQKHETPLITNE